MYKSVTGAIAVMAYQQARSQKLWDSFDANQLESIISTQRCMRVVDMIVVDRRFAVLWSLLLTTKDPSKAESPQLETSFQLEHQP